jgi:TonB family protein
MRSLKLSCPISLALMLASPSPASSAPRSSLSPEGAQSFSEILLNNGGEIQRLYTRRSEITREIESEVLRDHPDWRAVQRLLKEEQELQVRALQASLTQHMRLIERLSEPDKITYMRDLYRRPTPPPIVRVSGPPPAEVSTNHLPPVVPPKPRTELARLISADDYPPSALRLKQEGLVRFRLDVGPNGRVIGCMIRASSGSPALDAATCRILRSRSRFTPGRDVHNNPVPSTVTSEYFWTLPVMTLDQP